MPIIKKEKKAVSYIDMLKDAEKFKIYTDVETLDSYCEYLLNDKNKAINYANLMNLKDYIDSMDERALATNDSKMGRYLFIKYYLEAKLEKGVSSRKLAIRHVMAQVQGEKLKKVIENEILGPIKQDQLDKRDIQFVNNGIFARLNLLFLQNYKAGLAKIIEDVDADEAFDDQTSDAIMDFMQSLMSELSKAKRRSKQENRFNLTDPILFNSVMSEACDRLLSDAQYLTTGFKGLDKLLNGGFENARIYNFIGATGGFKSGLLLNLMKTIKKNNRGRVHKDMNKRPTILFVSQENNLWETIERIFSIFGKPDNIRNYTPEEIMKILKKGGFCVVDNAMDIDIEFRYQGNGDVSVPDLKGMYEELDNQGREVICIIQDYIERLRPPNMRAERRVQLFDISNQLHDLAQELDIPIITGSQFNKEGVATIESMQVTGKADIGKNVGTNNISESFGMLKNFDVNIGIVIEYDSKEERFYLSFRRLKLRGAEGELEYFLQPFVGTRSKIQLMEDGPLDQAVYRLSLRDDDVGAMREESQNLNRSVRQKRHLTDTFDIDLDDDSKEAEIYNALVATTEEADDIVQQEVDKFMTSVNEADDKKVYVPLAEEDNTRDEEGFIVLKPVGDRFPWEKLDLPGISVDI